MHVEIAAGLYFTGVMLLIIGTGGTWYGYGNRIFMSAVAWVGMLLIGGTIGVTLGHVYTTL